VKVSGPLSANNGEIIHRWALDGMDHLALDLDVSTNLKTGAWSWCFRNTIRMPSVQCTHHDWRIGKSEGVRSIPG